MPVNPTFYKRAYPDLAHLNYRAAITHHAQHGRAEGRVCCERCFAHAHPDYVDASYAALDASLAGMPAERRMAHFHAAARRDSARHASGPPALGEPPRFEPFLFSKYHLGTASPDDPIPVEVVHESAGAGAGKLDVCHLHLHDLTAWQGYRDVIDRVRAHMSLVVTTSVSDASFLEAYGGAADGGSGSGSVTVLAVPNKGYDIGGKIAFLHHFYAARREFGSVLFLHSKSDVRRRADYFEPLVGARLVGERPGGGAGRVALCLELLRSGGVDAIFPDLIWSNGERNTMAHNTDQTRELLKFLGLSGRLPRIQFPEGNCMYMSRRLVDAIFAGRTTQLYNNLNEGDSFDFNWAHHHYRARFGHLTIQQLHAKHARGEIHGCNNPLRGTPASFPDAMFEHAFERCWIEVVRHLGWRFVALDRRPVLEQFGVRLNALYFPQFHRTPENDRFWGDGFTEWTLLRPHAAAVPAGPGGAAVRIQKPHPDVGYYDLADRDVLRRQAALARRHGLHGFVVYHYWFHGRPAGQSPKVLHTPLEHFLSPDVDVPFAISWANETWSRRWDGSAEGAGDVLLQQAPGDEAGWREHVEYLAPFFRRPNYMRNEHGECIFYIYLTLELGDRLEPMLAVWRRALGAHGLKVRVVHTKGHHPANNKLEHQDIFVFQPVHQTAKLGAAVDTAYEPLPEPPNQDPRDAGAPPPPPPPPRQLASHEASEARFDAPFYLRRNPDLPPAFDARRAFEHWQDHGRAEGREHRFAGFRTRRTVRYEFDRVAESYLAEAFPAAARVHFGASLGWNNCVRRPADFMLVDGCTPEKAAAHLARVCVKAIRHANLDKDAPKFVNINAWNEWNEQAVLEPSDVHGYAYLEAVGALARA